MYRYKYIEDYKASLYFPLPLFPEGSLGSVEEVRKHPVSEP